MLQQNQNDVDFKTYVNNTRLKIRYDNQPLILSDLCLFSSFSFSGKVEEYVYYYLAELKKAGFSIAFISTSTLDEECISRISEFAFMIVERENKCPDFGSWKAGLSLLNWGQNLNSLLLVNDSVFGPFFDLGNIINTLRTRYDVWGMTDSYEVQYHVQSYFIYFNRAAIISKIFVPFWKNVDLAASKDDVIYKYEVGLSVLFKQSNFRLGAYASVDIVSKSAYHGHRIINPTLVFWKLMIEKYQFPFFKREALIKLNISKTYWQVNLYVNIARWKKVIQENTSYPLHLIDEFIGNYYKMIRVKNNDIVLEKRKILILYQNDEIEKKQSFIDLLRWLKNKADIDIEIITCANHGTKNSIEFDEFGVIASFNSLSDHDKQILKERLVDDVGLIISTTCENINSQKFFSFLDIPQIVFVDEISDPLKKTLAIEGNIDWFRNNIVQFIAGSQSVKKEFATLLGLAEEKIDLVHNFIAPYDIDQFKRSKRQIKTEIGIPIDCFVIGICGEFDWRNSADLIPVIAANICCNDNDIHIIWIGADKESELFERVKIDILKSPFGERIHLMEHKNDIRAFFSVFDVFLDISREPRFSLNYLRSSLAGKPVLFFQSPANSIDYLNYGIGHAIPYMNIAALSEKIMNFYNDREQLHCEEKVVSKIVKDNFVTDKQAPKILKIINKHFDHNELVLKESPVLTFMTHIYYENSWEGIRKKLKYFDNGRNSFLFSISEACLVKDSIIEDIRNSFQNAHFLITSNIGKDIGGKMALIDLYLLLGLQPSFIAFLHDKQSPHSIIGEEWKNDLFKILSPNNLNHIFSLFKNPEIGIIGAREYIVNEYHSETGTFRNNNKVSQNMLRQFNMALDNYDFLGGSIFWIRASIIKKFFEVHSPILMRENLEPGNVLDLYGETLSHTWERMFSWIATHQGFIIKGI